MQGLGRRGLCCKLDAQQGGRKAQLHLFQPMTRNSLQLSSTKALPDARMKPAPLGALAAGATGSAGTEADELLAGDGGGEGTWACSMAVFPGLPCLPPPSLSPSCSP